MDIGQSPVAGNDRELRPIESKSPKPTHNSTRDPNETIASAEAKLAAAKEELEAAEAKQEAAKEELKAAKEELKEAKEELKAAEAKHEAAEAKLEAANEELKKKPYNKNKQKKVSKAEGDVSFARTERGRIADEVRSASTRVQSLTATVNALEEEMRNGA